MAASVITLLIALAYLANGAWMLVLPSDWYLAIPGVTATGPMNPHFVRDIGFAYLLSGAALCVAVTRRYNRRHWLLLGSAWPALHALFHVGEWFSHGLPATAILFAELGAVVLPAGAGLLLACSAPARITR